MVPVASSVTCTCTGRRLPAFAWRRTRRPARLWPAADPARFRSAGHRRRLRSGQRLFFVGGRHVVEGDVSERRQLGGRADGAGHEARLVFAWRIAARLPWRACAAARLISATLSCRSYSASTMRVAPKVLVSTTSQPTLKKSAWMSLIMSGRLRTRSSLQPSLPQKSSTRGVADLDVGAHGAVVDDDAVVHGLEEVRH